VAVATLTVRGALAEVNTELAAVNGLASKSGLCLCGARNVDKISVGKASGLTGPAVNGNADVENILNVAEQVIEVLVGHFERHVANEEGAGRRSGLESAVVASRGPLPGGPGAVELADDVAALKDLLVEVVDGSLCIGNGLELDITEAEEES
jgi:hypothetical protein